MKKLVFGVAAFVAVAATGFAGTETYSGPAATNKEYKQVETASPFSDKEIQADVFGAYQVGNGPTHAGPIHDHAWGGGVAVNYFFTRYLGLSAEGVWLNGKDSPLDHRGSFTEHYHGAFRHFAGSANDDEQFQNANGNLIFRYPIDAWAIAPYVFIGGGVDFARTNWALGDVGAGLEYRVVPNKVGIFTDGRWNYYGDRDSHDVQNNFLFRLGTRLVF
jgi:hypothetical protein